MSIVVTNNDPKEVSAAPPSKVEETKEVIEAKPDAEVKASDETSHESDSDETGEDKESEGETESDETDEVEQRPKRQSGFGKRINKLNAKISAKDAEIEHWKSLALKNPKDGKAAEQSIEHDTKPEGRPVAEKFDTHEAYVEALADWKVDQRFAKEAEQNRANALKSEHSKIIQTFEERKKAFIKETSDYKEVMAQIEDDDFPTSLAFEQIVTTSEDGPKLLYELAKNPEELKRVNKLSPIDCALAIGELRASFKSPAQTAIKKISSAPEPVTPVRGATRGPAKTLEEAAKSGAAEYQKMRMAQIKKRESSWG